MTDSFEAHTIFGIKRRLETLSFDGDVWGKSLGELRALFDAETALAYLPTRGSTNWEFEFLHVALVSPQFERVQRLFEEFVTGQASSRRAWAAYDPVRPERAQRNRALHTSDLPRPRKLAQLYGKMGAPELEPDQVRVLICDGPRFVGWVGVVGYHPIAKTRSPVLQELVPALRTRLGFDELIRDRDLARASLEAAMASIELPCLLLDRNGRVEHLNEAARLLREREGWVIADAQHRRRAPDVRYDVRPVVVRGIPKSTLITIRPLAQPDRSRFARAARDWKLTPRQAGVFELVVAGLSNKQIAARLGVVEGTVELHLTAIFRKARVDSRTELSNRFWTQT